MTDHEFKQAVESKITEILLAEQNHAPTKEGKLLIQRINTLVARGGKRVRPLLLRLTYMAYSGENQESLLDIGAALELHHQFLLIHDDIIDNDVIRYDGPNIIGYYRNDLGLGQEIPRSMGLLAGDIVFTLASQTIINSSEVRDRNKLRIIKEMNLINIGVQNGQLLDTFNVVSFLDRVSLSRIIQTHYLKSALYTAQLPMMSAAILLGLKHRETVKIKNFAKAFGILFQLVDDHSDYFGNKSLFNNRTKYRDLRQGKITFPVLIALSRASKPQRNNMLSYLGQKNLPPSKIADVLTILADGGAEVESQRLISKYFDETIEALEKLEITPASRREFVSWVKQLIP